jgi:hypothetical protein
VSTEATGPNAADRSAADTAALPPTATTTTATTTTGPANHVTADHVTADHVTAREITEFLRDLARLRSPAVGADPAEHAALLARKTELFARIAAQHPPHRNRPTRGGTDDPDRT